MKTKFFVGLAVLFLTVNCGPKLDSENASKVVKTTFHLTEKDKVEITGIAKETNDVMLVKFQINGTEVNSKIRKYDKGWQLDEVQNKLGGWIPTATVSNQFDSTEKMKIAQKEIELMGMALTDYITDHGKFSFGPADNFNREGEIYKALCPLYVKSLPTTDPWGKPYHVLCGKSIAGQSYGMANGGADDFLIMSFGRSGKLEDWVYDPKNENAGLYDGYDPDKNIVYLNGSFIRAPKTWGTFIAK